MVQIPPAQSMCRSCRSYISYRSYRSCTLHKAYTSYRSDRSIYPKTVLPDTIVIRTYRLHKNLHILAFLLSMFGSEFHAPPSIYQYTEA